jgi:hypothetical protein
LKSFRDFFQLETTSDNRHNEGLYKVFSENFPISDSRNNFVARIPGLFHRPAALFHRRMYRAGPHAQRTPESQAEVVLYRSRTRGFRNHRAGCVPRYHSVHDTERHLRDQRGGTCRGIPADTVHPVYSLARAAMPTAQNCIRPG